MIVRHMTIGAGFRLVANRLPLAYSSIPLRLTSIAYCDPISTSPSGSFPRRILERGIHSDTSSMSSSTSDVSSEARPADSSIEASSSIVSSSTAQEATTAPKDEPSSNAQQKKEEKKLPPLRGAEFRAYNRLAEHMDVFHAHFRTSWNSLWAAACAGNSKIKASSRGARSVINDGLAFISQLEMHHSIEETYIFPILAQRMPEFRTDGKGGKSAAELLRQHREIHDGMEGMRKYLRACRDGEKELDMSTLKAQMESWGSVLWKHLDQEVETLGAENMRKYWTAEEIRRIPM
ncbi:hypothetical protein F5Y05DRAFT_192812 [Hypoxylon sp. FL0543]|nr:hypothetical protein F5Y05DRAFT_192812 [Hypoxylon sp. FL0543]